ncbi:hypothetical protein BH24DEI1_BH24DEI1_01120 [soil metagenome]|jgi:catechol 2,3-dioxygenase-like lactoylglutathione lyase family enzyme|nr:VOC family protein [Deinococcota bacterium]
MENHIRCQHICLITDRLSETHDFYVGLLGLKAANYNESVGLLAFRLDDGFVLRFEANGSASPSSIRFLGLELDSFEQVDRLHDKLAKSIEIVQDLRAQFTSAEGPYGFLIEDPNGYRIKLFRYGPRTDA